MSSHRLNPHCPDWATALLNGFSQIVFQRHPLCGLLCLLAILVSAPALLGGALLGGLAGLLTAQRRGYAKAERQAGLYGYNGILLGLLLNHHLPWSILVPPLTIAAGGLSAILTHHWLKHSQDQRGLAPYTAPFVILAWLLLSAMESAPTIRDAPLVNDYLGVSGALFKGLGQIMLLDHPLAGGLIALGLWLSNPKAAAWALCGAGVGLAFGLLQHDPSPALLGLAGYNPALAALALSQDRRHPRWLPLTGIVMAIALTPGFAALGLPVLTAPYMLACWILHAGLRAVGPSTAQ